MAGRMFNGNSPSPDEGWESCGAIQKDSFNFSVFVKPWNNGWRMVKVCSTKKVKDKANYWLSWNGERFANGKDYKAMVEHKPWAIEQLDDMFKSSVIADTSKDA